MGLLQENCERMDLIMETSARANLCQPRGVEVVTAWCKQRVAWGYIEPKLLIRAQYHSSERVTEVES